MRNDQEILNEVMPLIKANEKNLTYFFGKVSNPRWLTHLISNNLFDPRTIPAPIKTEKGYSLPFWPQQLYLDKVSKLINDVESINAFLGILLKIESVHGNFLLGRSLFLSASRIPFRFLNPEAIDHFFSWVKEPGGSDTFIESGVHEGLANILDNIQNTPQDRAILKVFFQNLLTIVKSERESWRDTKFLYFSSYGQKMFLEKHFKIDEIQKTKEFVLVDALDVAENNLLEAFKTTKLDQSTQNWRPAVEKHYQNNHHDTPQALLVEFIFLAASTLIAKDEILEKVLSWGHSPFFTFNRIYFILASLYPDRIEREVAAEQILRIGLSSHCRHEVFIFLKEQFEHLNPDTQDKILNLIDAVKERYADREELSERYTAWERLRWLEAINNSKLLRVLKMREEMLLITEGQVPDHPDFGSYMGRSWVGPTSPKSKEELAKVHDDELFKYLVNFKDSDEFGAPSIDGLARTLEDLIATDPLRGSLLVSKMEALDYRYTTAILDGYSKSWNEKRYVPVNDLVSKSLEVLKAKKFRTDAKDSKSRARWVIGSICGFVEAGTRSDENAFPSEINLKLQQLLKECLKICPPDERFGTSGEAYSRAINEPRGRVFGALIILALRRGRISKGTVEFTNAWKDLRLLISPIVKNQDENEVSLHALIGAHFRQFLFLNKDWVYRNIDLIVPANKPILWRAFMDGFSYVTDYNRKMYELLKRKGHLINYLRLESDPLEKSSKRDRLQTRIVELALVAFVLKHEQHNDGVLGSILDKKDGHEWHQVIWSVRTIIGDKPKPEHLQRAKELVNAMLDIKQASSQDESWKEHFKGIGRFLVFLEDPTDPLVERIFEVVAADTESPWEVSDLVDYLHRFKDTNTSVVAKLYVTLLTLSQTAPTYPPDKVREICQALVRATETSKLIEICKIYEDRTLDCEPIRDICKNIN